ncbi:pyruvate/2-oxoglutarate dehydrogenase complex dihydrolipoamide dehydrogenase (E3) component [Roseiarcus fermentans]|uniref:Pyruvate/2-oxoglutarate dehydrogenase complex dihydrolipoamide dehydrogenase (E3) component n=1 Tax=Roseiarcus fermentans TaxID=1473586 RepID=A0A366F386_9HYPH|nr:FAD-containing oxidoreductase [Roseiarcus fermentans]RBP09064.1 pyruvate/2-oxoglutarate dehydrogenase complex dihydrolipoamide dehydrogenase (E3) component [Roseiarcus fermentans]
MTRRFDAVVIGAGQAGPAMAGRFAGAGKSVAVVERERVGGTCVNVGCTPTKTLVASAYAAHLARRAADYGVSAGPVGVDFAAVRARMLAIVGDKRAGLESWLAGMPTCALIRGHARFVAPHAVEVGGETLEAEQIFINVGARAAIPDFPGLDRVRVLTNTSLLDLDALPRHLVVVGGSYIGLEFAQVFRRLGAEVTVIEKAPRLVAREDPDVSEAIRAILEAEGIAVRCDAECIRFAPQGTDVEVGVDCRGGAPTVVGSHVLLAVGRKPNTDDLGLDAAGVAVDGRGFIVVDDALRTSVPHIFALGDCNGRGAFTHTAYNDYEIVAANLFDGATRKVTDRIPAYALYVDPPLGRVGLSEADAKARGHVVRVGKRPMTRVARAIEKGETQGFIKVVVDRDSDAILGAAILGVGGDEAIHGVIEAMAAGRTATDYTRVVAIHPTVSELVPTVFGALDQPC